jgi:hypothetical protein
VTPRCQEIQERLVEAATGSLPPQARAGIAEHLAECALCTDEAAAIEVTAARLREAGQFAVPPGFWAEFTGRLQERLDARQMLFSARARRWLSSPRHAWGTMAATAAVAAAITVVVRMAPPRAAVADPDIAAARRLVTETMTTTLPSLSEMLETWRAGLMVEGEGLPDGSRP